MALLKWPIKNTNKELSERHLWQLFNSLNDVVLALDKDQKILTVNQCWQNLTGVSVDQSLDLPLNHFIHPEDINQWHQLLQRLSPDQSELIWFRLLHSSGEFRWCEMRIQSMRESSLYPLSATLCDITPQVRNEQIRQASHRSLQSLVNRLPAMLYRTRNNISWTIDYVSGGCQALTGYSTDELLNQLEISIGTMIHPDYASYVWEGVQGALQQYSSFDLEYVLVQKDGKEIWVRDKGHGQYSESGVVLGVEGFIFQTQRKNHD
ncbi:PAS domain-containing protein [Reinekea thalattae]|nr:PAS domain-containing protein [Reinekea thalattae]